MAIKVKAKDADTLEEELEEWSLGVNLVNTAPTQTKETVTFSTDQIKKDKSKKVKLSATEIKGTDNIKVDLEECDN